MGLFRKEVVIMKDTSDAKVYLQKLEELLPQATGKVKERIKKDIAFTKAGIAGEDNILFELKNSGMDMVVLQDICLESDGQTAQIDFLIITGKDSFVIECKNLYGNIEINHKGDFIRVNNYGGKRVKTGFYSPVTQNERHMQILKNVIVDNNTGLRKAGKSLLFDRWYKSLVVLANPKTILNDRYAPKDVKEKVIRADQLVATIKAMNAECHDLPLTVAEMKDKAEWLLAKNVEDRKDYLEKYKKMMDAVNSSTPDSSSDEENFEESPDEENTVVSSAEETSEETLIEENTETSSADAEQVDDNNSAESSSVKETQVQYNSEKTQDEDSISGTAADAVEEQSVTAVSPNGTEAPSMVCPKCGSPMVLRTAKKGNNIGKQFWGCSAFPKCRKIINID